MASWMQYAGAQARKQLEDPDSILRKQVLPAAARKFVSAAPSQAQDVSALYNAYKASEGDPRRFLHKNAAFRETVLPQLADKYKDTRVGKVLGYAKKASDMAKMFGLGRVSSGPLRTGGGKRMRRQYGERAKARHHAMRLFAAAGHPLGAVSKMAAEAVRKAEASGQDIGTVCRSMMR